VYALFFGGAWGLNLFYAEKYLQQI
jgi:hypothetical protein